nr:IclR family transcriptional regulator [Gordonia humi]
MVGALLKACTLLDHFGADQPTWTLNDLTAASGMNKTTVHRLMATLIHAGWVDRTGDGSYRVTVRLFEIGSSALADMDIRSAAQTHMASLAAEFGDTAFLMVPAAEGAVCIDKIDGTASLVVAGINIGTVLPYHAAAGPVVILAHSQSLRDKWIRDDLPEYTGRTLHTPEALAAHLDEVREVGYSVSDSDFLDDVAAVAAPILDASGRILGSISVGGRAEHFTGAALQTKIARVVAAAARISTVLQAAG